MFPSVINTFNIVSATDRLNSPSHSALHNSVSSVVTQVETFLGTASGANASAVGTLMHDVRSPDSNGGGHIQTAVKGGTGQTTFTKGDTLVATSPSVLSKLAVGIDGQALVADSSVAAGIKWGTPGGTKIANSASIFTISSVQSETSILSVSLPGSTLGTSGAVKTTAFVTNFVNGNDSSSVLVAANYGGTRVASVLVIPTSGSPSFGTIEYILISNNNISQQRGNLIISISPNKLNFGTIANSVIGGLAFVTGTSSVNSSANQPVGLSATFSRNSNVEILEINGYTVEKIV